MLKTKEAYINDYRERYKALEAKNELWRLRVTEAEFIIKLDEIFAYAIKEKKSNCLNDYAIESNQKGAIAVMMMNVLTIEEAKAQFERNRILANEYFQEAAPEIQERIKNYILPLNQYKIRTINSALQRNQITIDMFPPQIKAAFVLTRQYESLVKRQKH